ncbi:ABC transporter permease [Halobium salinum]|uniref:ABC transporter permease n=1 Tax=Halobium salinum TaxID=1364940 RepID=A0ABD5P6K7_9EURY|nr:ABC transporter permease [Halobium salinum]
MATDTDGDLGFERIDWSSVEGRRSPVGVRTLVFVLGTLLLVSLYLYDRFYVAPGNALLLSWDTNALDWPFLFSLLAFGCYVLWPLAANPVRTGEYWRRLRTNPVALLAFAYLGAFFALGTLGPVVFGDPAISLDAQHQPPAFLTGSNGLSDDCLGAVTGPTGNPVCHGTLEHPLGTDSLGRSMWLLVLSGMRVALQVTTITSVLIVPIAVAVGTVAGSYGGRVDTVLMRYVDVQQTVPALLVYLIGNFVYGRSILLFIVVFGLLNWGSVARVVRSEVIQRRQEQYVTAARNAGAGRLEVIRRHILPNVSSSVVTALTQQIPILILTEAAISFLELNNVNRVSWGETIVNGLSRFPRAWWTVVVPVAVLCLTVVSFALVGDALRDVLDPRNS